MKKSKKILFLLAAVFITFAMIGGCKKSIGVVFKPSLKGEASVTSNAQPTWTWTIQPGAKAYRYRMIKDGSTDLPDWIVVSVGDFKDGKMSFKPAEPLLDGSYTLFLQIQDSADLWIEDESKMATFTIAVDTKAPDSPVSYLDGIDEDSPGYFETNNQKPVLKWNLTESAVKYIVGYEYALNGDAVSPIDMQDDKVSYYRPSVIVNGLLSSFVPDLDLPSGYYRFYVIAVDAVGNVSTGWEKIGNNFLLKVAANATNIPIIKPSSEDSIKVGDQYLTSNGNMVWEIGIENPNEERRGFRYQLDGKHPDLWTDVETMDKVLRVSPILRDEGKHVLYVQTKDLNGNYSILVTESVVFDKTGPQAPVVDFVKTDNVRRPSWKWDVPNGEAYQYRFKLCEYGQGFGNSVSILTDLSLKTYTVANDLADNLPGEYYTFQIQFADRLGNWSDFGVDKVVIKSTIPQNPVPVCENLQAGKNATNDSTPTWKWATVAGAKYYRCSLDNEVNWKESNECLFTPKELLADGKQILSVQSSADGISWSASGISETFIDSTPPMQPIISGPSSTASLKPVWSWIIDADVKSVQWCLAQCSGVEIPSDLSWTSDTRTISDPELTVSFTPQTDLVEGNYVFLVKFQDDMGNWCDSSLQKTRISTKLPPSPVFVIDSASPQTFNIARTSATTLTWKWEWNFPAASGTILGYCAFLDKPNEACDDSKMTQDTFYTSSVLDGGYHTIYVYAKVNQPDLLNPGQFIPSWSGAGSFQTYIDLIGPDAPVVTGSEPTNNRKPDWFWTVPSGTTGFRWQLVSSDNITPVTHTDALMSVANPDSVVSFKPDVELAGNDSQKWCTLFVEAKDDLGNWSEPGSYTVYINTTPIEKPELTLLTTPRDEAQKWVWSSVPFADGYRCRLVGAASWKIKKVGDVGDREYTAPGKDDGIYTLEVQARNTLGIWSEISTKEALIDTTAPVVPRVYSLYDRINDTTPLWWWDLAPDAVCYYYKLKKPADGEVTRPLDLDDPSIQINDSDLVANGWVVANLIANYTPETALPYNAAVPYTLYVMCKDQYGNFTVMGSKDIYVDVASQNNGKPSYVTINNVSKSYIKDTIKIEWKQLLGVETYCLYRLTDANLSSGIGTLIKTIHKTEGTSYLDKDLSLMDNTDYYYRISGRDSNNDEGPLSLFANSEEKKKSRGTLIHVPNSVVCTASASAPDLKVSWAGPAKDVQGSLTYRILRTGPFLAVKDAVALESETWSYLDTAGTWTICSDPNTFDMSGAKAITETSYTDVNLNAMDVYYYRINSVNDTAKLDSSLQGNPQMSDKYYVGKKVLAEAVIMPADITTWLTASDNKTSVKGKIEVGISVPAGYLAAKNKMVIDLKRTYRYGGGYQGHNATTADLTSHVNLLNPDPRAGDFEKTITLMTQTGSSIVASTIYLDTGYDTNVSNEKLFAVWNKKVKNTDCYGNENKCFAWYERTDSQISVAGENFQKIGEAPDGLSGAPVEFEWSYLIWDWVVRKYMQHPARAGASTNKYLRFDINQATRCDYTLTINNVVPASVNNKNSRNVTPVYGWAALTEREFAHLAMFLRDEAFLNFSVTFADETLNAQNDQPPTDDVHASGKFEGKMHMTGASGGASGLAASFATENGPSGRGYADFPNCFVRVDWSMSCPISIGGDPRRAIYDGPKTTPKYFFFDTPRWKGSIGLVVDLCSGTYYHGVYDLSAPGEAGVWVKVSTPSETNYINNTRLPYTIANEMSGTGGWTRASESSPSTGYNDRYTAINWKYLTKGYIYPNCLSNPNTSNPWQ